MQYITPFLLCNGTFGLTLVRIDLIVVLVLNAVLVFSLLRIHLIASLVPLM